MRTRVLALVFLLSLPVAAQQAADTRLLPVPGAHQRRHRLHRRGRSLARADLPAASRSG